MNDAPQPKRNRLVVDLPEEDRAWVRAQSEATGWNSEALVVRMLIKDAREKGLEFAVVAQGPHAPAQAPRPMGVFARPRLYSAVEPVSEEAPEPVPPAEVESLLAERLGEVGIDAATLATEPWPDLATTPPMAGVPLAVNGGVAVSLAPAPARSARDYR